jgi:NitT/TauT family transport system permease protein/taurine transport system permease protein
MIGASQGIGWMVAMGGQTGNSSEVLLGVSLIGLIAWLMESLVFRRIERRYESWRGQQ